MHAVFFPSLLNRPGDSASRKLYVNTKLNIQKLRIGETEEHYSKASFSQINLFVLLKVRFLPESSLLVEPRG